jgi:hypothetical protein
MLLLAPEAVVAAVTSLDNPPAITVMLPAAAASKKVRRVIMADNLKPFYN